MNQEEKEQTSQVIVEICQKVIENLASQHNASLNELMVRVDMMSINDKPLFGVFKKSQIVAKPSLSEIIRAGGGGGVTMIASMYVRNIIKKIFVSSMEAFEIKDTKRIHLLMYLKRHNNLDCPIIALFRDEQYMDSAPMSEFIGIE